MLKVKSSIQKNMRSYGFAAKGISLLFAENNFKFQLLAAITAIALGFRFGISTGHWLIIIICIGIVLMAEAFNTAIEKLCNHLHPQQHPSIGVVKDIAAAAVFLIAIATAVVGAVIFWQYF